MTHGVKTAMVRVLVVGFLAYDSGKTTVAEALIRECIRRGIDVGVAKPVSSYNAWYQHRYFEESIRLGVLVGEDVMRLHRAARSNDPIEAEGPVVGALAPPDPSRLGWRTSVYADLASSTLHQMVILRITRCTGRMNPLTTHAVIHENLERSIEPVQKMTKKMIGVLSGRINEISLQELEELLENKAPAIADTCLEQVCEAHENVIIESYNDVAAPTQGSLRSDVVVAVGPGRAAVYRGDLYRRGLEVTSQITKPWSTTTRRVLSVLKPEGTVIIDFKKAGDVREPWSEQLFDLIEKLYSRHIV